MQLKLVLICIFFMVEVLANGKSKYQTVEGLQNEKEFKKLLKSKNNILVLYTSNLKDNQNVIKIFRESSEQVKGLGTLVVIDCSSNDLRKLCKKLKIVPEPYVIKHYKDGEFHKEYDRQIAVSSITNFIRDPTGDIPWEEDEKGVDVVHVPDTNALTKLLKKEMRPVLVMFYAPWCKFCKVLKPEYSEAATELKPKYVLAAIDVNRPENAKIRKQYDISGFPTLLYFENSKMRFTFEGENTKAGIIAFMENPGKPIQKPKDDDWSADPNSEIVHLTSDNFEPALKDEKSAIVMFYAPWCGHCKRMKPDYEKAAVNLRTQKISGVLTALDATKDAAIASKFGVTGYPTLKYFSYGEFKFDVSVRETDKIVEFMKDPKEPPPPPPPEKPWDEEPSDVVHLNVEEFKPFLKKKTHVLVMFYAPWCGHCKNTKPEFIKSAAKFSDDPTVAFAAVDCTKYAAVCSRYEVKGYPTIKYFSHLKTEKVYNGGRTEGDFVKYITNAINGIEVDDTPKAEAFGDFPGVEKVLMLTDSDFDAKIQSLEGVLVMFYAPWCGHCKRMKPDVARAALLLETERVDGKIAAVDCTVHRKLTEKYGIKGFPTIKYFEKGKVVAEYDDSRTAEKMVDFIKKRRKANGTSKDEL